MSIVQFFHDRLHYAYLHWLMMCFSFFLVNKNEKLTNYPITFKNALINWLKTYFHVANNSIANSFQFINYCITRAIFGAFISVAFIFYRKCE